MTTSKVKVRTKTKSGKLLSTNPRNVRRRQRRAEGALKYEAAKARYEKAQIAAEKRINELNKVMSGSGNDLRRVINNASINDARFESERKKARAERKVSMRAFNEFADTVSTKLKQDIASVKIAKNTLTRRAADMAGVDYRKSKKGNIKPVFSNDPAIAAEEKKEYARARRTIRLHDEEHGAYWGIYRKMLPANAHIDSEQVDEAIYRAISIDDRVTKTQQKKDPNFVIGDQDKFERVEGILNSNN